MIKVSFTMIDSMGNSVEIVREFLGELVDRNLHEVESLICEIKAETMQASELSLLELNQKKKEPEEQ